MIRPLRHILVRMLPVEEWENLKRLGVRVMDGRKHWENAVREGIVESLPEGWSGEFGVGDRVMMKGSAGRVLEGPEDGSRAGYGEGWRWLEGREVMAVTGYAD